MLISAFFMSKGESNPSTHKSDKHFTTNIPPDKEGNVYTCTIHAAKYMILEHILTKISQSQKDKCHIIPL